MKTTTTNASTATHATRLIAMASALVLTLAATAAHAQTLITHTGAANPTTEGWAATGTATLGSTVANDNGTAAWQVNDNSATASLLYVKVLTEAEANKVTAEGWTLSVTLRVTDTNNAPDLTRYVDYVDINKKVRWGLDFGSTSTGHLTVSLRGSALTHTFADSDYHSFSLVYNSVAGTASLFIDNATTATLTGYTGAADTNIAVRHLRWGSSSGTYTGSANYANISFVVGAPIPEPATIASIAGLLALTFVIEFRIRTRLNHAGHCE
ncbi:hypothetical protein Ga0100231_014405 [Opitutaceae bacterium TAV4]|nr:hypothetical protein Ga0100231_014405 [Opitutaceae bacterium TAV4]RRJ99557.1 hypothetical protein Ga0100230_015605 [Opitutaceae bacterium TAV3]